MCIRYFGSIIGILLLGCRGDTPAEFWKKFETALLVEVKTYPRPQGAAVTMHWSSNNDRAFEEKQVLDYAVSNGWYPVDTTVFDKSEVAGWRNGEQQIFPVYLLGLHKVNHLADPSPFMEFERRIEGDITVYRLKTDRFLIYPGSRDSTAEDGYILIGRNGAQLSVYQVWGE